MTLDQYISAGASLGAFLAAGATLLTVWQMAKQRVATYRPEIVVLRAPVVTIADESDKTLRPLLGWCRSIEDSESNVKLLHRDYRLLLVNIGMGSATRVLVEWEFPMERFVGYIRMSANSRNQPIEIELHNGAVSVESIGFTSIWENQRQDNFDYILPAEVDKDPIKIRLPSAYILAVSACMNVYLREIGTGTSARPLPEVPALRMSLHYDDISGKRHKNTYDIEFEWYGASRYEFEGALVPKRV